MNILSTAALSLSFLLAPLAVQAQSANSDLYVIPVASHTPGANGVVWMSDVAIQNIDDSPLTVQLIVVESGEGNLDNVFPLTTGTLDGSVVVPANGSVLLADVMNGYRGMTSASGAILVGADHPFAVTSRSYVNANGGWYGQTVTPARDFLENAGGTVDPENASAYIPGLINNSQFRTNLGFVAANTVSSGETVGITVTLRNASGTVIGTRLFNVPAGQFTQVQFSASSISNSQFDIGGAEFEITQGSGSVVPYASVVNNVTADATFILGQFPAPSSLGLGKAAQRSIFRELFDRVKR